ncbi:MAG: SDR family NAD(P)-dependent oxidoreductase [Pseudomonadales bacterium]
MNFKHQYGPWALVTGGAQGMGAAFAAAIGEHGLNLILLDREQALLETTAATLRSTLKVDVITVCADLAEANFLDTLMEKTAQCEIGLLVACAATGHVGPFEQTPLGDMLGAVAVNVNAPLILTHHYCKPMIERQRGGVILFASSAAYQGTPYVANYGATKAYNLSLGEALWYELSKHKVDVLAISPGGTNTPGFRSANPGLKEGQKVKGVMLPEDTAAAALKALGNVPSARPSLRDTLETILMTRIFSRRKAISLICAKITSDLTRNIKYSNQ